MVLLRTYFQFSPLMCLVFEMRRLLLDGFNGPQGSPAGVNVPSKGDGGTSWLLTSPCSKRISSSITFAFSVIQGRWHEVFNDLLVNLSHQLFKASIQRIQLIM